MEGGEGDDGARESMLDAAVNSDALQRARASTESARVNVGWDNVPAPIAAHSSLVDTDANNSNYDQETATSARKPTLVTRLADKSARVNIEVDDARALLILAASNGEVDVIQYLLDNGADVNSMDDDGWTSLMHAASSDRVDVVAFLVSRGADVDVVDNDGQTSLMHAASTGNVDVVRYLVASGADVNAVDNDEWTSLMHAATSGQVDVVECLLDRGANANAVDIDGATSLMHAASSGELDVVQYLLDRGADMNFMDNDGETSLIHAVSSGELCIVQYLVDRGADINAQDYDGQSLLIHASRKRQLGVVQCLVESGANVNATENDGWTSMMHAASGGELAVVEYLVSRGADVDAEDNDGQTLLMHAASSGKAEIAQYFVDKGADVNAVDHDEQTPLMHAAQKGNLKVVQFLVDRGVDVNAVGKSGWTSLMRAASSGKLDTVKYLVGKGAAMSGSSDDGVTLLMNAVSSGRLDVVQYLVDRGADVNATDNDGWTSMMRAASSGELRIVQFLVDSGAVENIVDNDGWTSLIHAASSGELEVVKYFVDRGGDVNATDNDGWSLLMHAVSSGNLGVVRFLVDRHADINAVDKNGRTVLMLGTAKDQLSVVQYLVDKGADVNIKTPSGQTALFLATKHGHINMRRFLLQHVKRMSTYGGSSEDLTADSGMISLSSSTLKSWTVSPFDIELVDTADVGTVGGEYRAKWLDADVVVKLFVPGASASTFDEEVTVWHHLRHPNVIKLYGACDIGHSFFVLEYASNGSLLEYLANCKQSGSRCTPWKFLHEAALGLAYLHERKIVHGNLRSSNILVGSDGVAKLADFGQTVSATINKAKPSASSGTFGSVRWQAPEQLRGGSEGASFAADIYSFGLCTLEAVTGRAPWEGERDQDIAFYKAQWDPTSASSRRDAPGRFDAESLLFVSRMCRLRPDQRVSAADAVRLLEELAMNEASRPETDNAEMNATDFKSGALVKLVSRLRDRALQCPDKPLYQAIVQELDMIHQQLVRVCRPSKILEEYHSLLVDVDGVLHPASNQNQVTALSFSRAVSTNLTVLRRRFNNLWVMLDGPQLGNQQRELRWELHRKEQLELFVSYVSQTMAVFSGLNDDEERYAFIILLKTEIDSHASDYTESQLEVMKKAYAEICDGDWAKSVTPTPVWFLLWYELVIDKMKRLGMGGFGDVYLAKWLDSEVVVKQAKSIRARNTSTFSWSLSTSHSGSSIRASPHTASFQRQNTLLLDDFQHEVDVWFGLSHPHVVRLFGACHIGTPFFACEYAGGGSLDKYLRKHPDEIWTKLQEAALGVQYLQSRGIVHGDLKCNNIVVGNDGKAKVTDFGLSSLEDESDAKLTGAWQWVAPECIECGASRRSFASDVYALGMCVVEALRVVESVKLGKVEGEGPPVLPWGDFNNSTVKHYVTKRRELPKRPGLCTDGQWDLVKRMCAHDSTKRLKITTVVDELAVMSRRQFTEEKDTTEPELEYLEVDRSLLDVVAKTRTGATASSIARPRAT